MADIRDQWEAAVLASNLRDALKVCAWAIRFFANSDGECFPSAATLAEVYRTTRRTVFRHLDTLEAAGWIRRAPGKGASGKGGKTTLIGLQIPASGDTHSVTTSDDEVVTKTALSGDKNSRSGDKNTPSGDSHGVTRTNRTINHRTRAKRGSRRAPKNFRIDADMQAWLRGEGIPLDFAQREAEKFLDYEYKTPKRDWNATFRTWMRNAKEWQSPATTKPPAGTQTDELAAQLGLTRRPGESDEVFRVRVSNESINERYGYSVRRH